MTALCVRHYNKYFSLNPHKNATRQVIFQVQNLRPEQVRHEGMGCMEILLNISPHIRLHRGPWQRTARSLAVSPRLHGLDHGWTDHCSSLVPCIGFGVQWLSNTFSLLWWMGEWMINIAVFKSSHGPNGQFQGPMGWWYSIIKAVEIAHYSGA